VREWGYAYVHSIELLRLEHFLVMSEGFRSEARRGLISAAKIGIGKCRELDVFEVSENVQMPAGDAADADEAQPCFLHGTSPLNF
jgi:hypothetical protein